MNSTLHISCNKIRYLKTYLFILVSLFSFLAKATPSIKDYGLLPDVSQVVISPNGELFAFRKTSLDNDYVLIYSASTSKQIGGLDVSAIDPQHFYFSNDESLILVASQYKKLRNYRHAFDISTAFTYSIKTKTVRPLIRAGQPLRGDALIYMGQTGMGRIVGVSKDSKYIFMPAFVGSSDLDQAPNYALLRVKANGKGKPKVVSKGTDHVTDYFLDGDGNVIARESYKERLKLHTLEVYRNKKWVPIFEEETELLNRSFIGLTADAKNIIFLAYQEDRVSYYTLSLSDGKETQLPFNKADADIENTISDHNNINYGIRYSGFTPTYQFFDEGLQKRFEAIQAQFPEHSVWLEGWSDNFNDIVVKVEGSNYAGDYFLSSKNQELRFIASERPKLKVEDINLIGRVTYKARDGLAIPTLLTIPRDKGNDLKNLPAVLMPHGGPAAYDHLGFDYLAQALASRGYLVIQPQFRGSSGFGLAHKQAGYGQWGKKMQQDLTDAVKFFTKKGIINPKRVCIAGASYGGYAALAGATFTPDLYQCVFSLAGISHIPRLVKADRSRYGKRSKVINYIKKTIGGGKLNKKRLNDISPYFFAHQVKAPIMLAHGEDDTRVEYTQSKLMASALKNAGKPFEFIKLKDEDHHLQDPETRLQAVTALVNFVNKHLGAASQTTSKSK